MNQYSTEPEYSVVVQSGKIIPFTVPSKDTMLICMDQVAAELRLLSKELSMSVDILGKILDSVRVLEQSLEVH